VKIEQKKSMVNVSTSFARKPNKKLKFFYQKYFYKLFMLCDKKNWKIYNQKDCFNQSKL